jgi:hypothetical protein
MNESDAMINNNAIRTIKYLMIFLIILAIQICNPAAGEVNKKTTN